MTLIDRLRKSVDPGDNVAVYVDGPNMIRSEFDLDLDDLREAAEGLGNLKIAKMFLNQFASDKLIEAIIAQGFEAELGLAGQKDRESDVDVYMAVSAMEAVFDDDIDVVVLVTRDTDFLPVIQKTKEHGKRSVIVAVESGFSTALENAADQTIFIGDSE